MSDSTISVTQAATALQEAAVIQDGRGFPNPYSKVERIRRALWVVVNAMLYRPVPRLLKGWHITWLRLFGARLGRGTVVHPSAEIYFPWRLQTGDFCVIGDRVRIYCLGFIRIGDHTVISQHAHLCAGTHDYTLPHMPLIRSDIQIGRGCWICADAFVGPGVRVGDHTVIGARSVVVKDMPARMVCGGNPCRPLKPRATRLKADPL